MGNEGQWRAMKGNDGQCSMFLTPCTKNDENVAHRIWMNEQERKRESERVKKDREKKWKIEIRAREKESDLYIERECEITKDWEERKKDKKERYI